MPSPSLLALDIADEGKLWAALGFRVEEDRLCRVGAVDLCFGAWSSGGRGVTAWSLRAGEDGVRVAGTRTVLDGLPTRFAASRGRPPWVHPNTALSVDHVVLRTPDVDRTLLALSSIGMRLRAERAVSRPRPLRQAFFRHGEAIVEVVGPRAIEGDGPACLWGITVTVADLQTCASLLGDRLGDVCDAVQPGRRIATVRSRAGVGVALALMTPPPR